MDISPDKQNVSEVFSSKTYYIDFYQRDYRWTDRARHPAAGRYILQIPRAIRTVQGPRSQERDGHRTLSLVLPEHLCHQCRRRPRLRGGWAATAHDAVADPDQATPSREGTWVAYWTAGSTVQDCRVVRLEQEFWMNHVGHKAAQQALLDGKTRRPSM